MTLQEYADRELKLANNIPAEKKEFIMNLISQMEETASTSQAETAKVVSRLMDYKPLTPLKGTDDEWNKVDDYNEDDKALYQNKRCFSVFKRGKNGRPYYSKARIFSTDGGKTWHLNGSESHEYITFPFTVPDMPRKINVKYIDADTGEILND